MAGIIRKLWELGTPYISEKGAENLKVYKYVGGDNSYTYKYLLGPLAEALLKIYPATLAPNVITVISLIINVTVHLLMLVLYGTSMEGHVSSWFCILNGISYFAYVVNDNIDGKQARRTGAASPLGLLFDHQVDALSCFMCTLTLMRVVQVGRLSFLFLGNNIFVALAILIIVPPFFYATLEEYYTGELILPAVNGVSDGAIGLVIINFFTGIVGNDFWLQTTHIGSYEVRYSWILCVSILTSSQIPLFMNIIKICKRSKVSLLNVLITTNIFNFLMVSLVLVSVFSLSGLIQHTPRILMFTFCMPFVKLTAHLQISHVTHMVFNPIKKTVIVTALAMLLNTLSGYVLKQTILPEKQLLYALFFINFIAYYHLVYHVIREMSKILGIRPFSIIKPTETKQLNKPPIEVGKNELYGEFIEL